MLGEQIRAANIEMRCEVGCLAGETLDFAPGGRSLIIQSFCFTCAVALGVVCFAGETLDLCARWGMLGIINAVSAGGRACGLLEMLDACFSNINVQQQCTAAAVSSKKFPGCRQIDVPPLTKLAHQLETLTSCG